MRKNSPFAFYFLYFAANSALVPYIVLYYQAQHFNGAQIGLLTSLAPLLGMIGAPLWTGLADATHRHRLILSLAMLATIGIALLYPLQTAFLPVVCVVIIFALFSSPVIAFADSATMGMLGGRRELFGRLRLGGTIGWGVASLVIGALIEAHGLRLAFYLFAGLMFLAFLTGQALTFNRAPAGNSFITGARQLLASGRFVRFLLMAVLCGIALSTVNSYLFSYLAELQATESMMGWAQTISTISEFPVLLFSNRLLKRLKPSRMLVLGLLFTVVRLLLYGALSTPQAVLVSQMMNGLTYAMIWVAGVSFAYQSAPPGMSATGQGLFGAMVMGIGSAIGNFTGSLLLEALGGRGMFTLVGVFVLLGLGVLLGVERIRQVQPGATHF